MFRHSLFKTISVRTIRKNTANLTTTRAMHIQSIPMWQGSTNNYAYLVVDDKSKSKDAVIIDPAHPVEVIPVLKPQVDNEEIKLVKIINTHHHWDHAGGNSEMLKSFKGLPVVGGKDCQAVTTTPKHEESFKIGENIRVTALHTPCHTQDSICWYMQDAEDKVIFTGDTLFIGGCGRFFEGTPEEMDRALQTLARLPNDTKVYPGHEYTAANVEFLKKVSQAKEVATYKEFISAVDKLEKFAEDEKQTQGKKTIGDEKEYNAFMRVRDEACKKFTGESEPAEVMRVLRELKNAG